MRKVMFGIAALFLVTGTAHADPYSDLTQKLRRLLDHPGLVMQCGDIRIFVRNGKLDATGLEGSAKLTADGNTVYVNDKPCELKCERSC